jgi:hypothetical protein
LNKALLKSSVKALNYFCVFLNISLKSFKKIILINESFLLSKKLLESFEKIIKSFQKSSLH